MRSEMRKIGKEERQNVRLKEGKEFERRVYAHEVRVADESEGEAKIVGYAAVFDKWSRDLGSFIERIKPGFFEGLLDDPETFALFNHNYDMPLAAIKNRSLTLSVDAIGLRYEFVAPDTTAGRDLVTNVRSGLVSESSFGFAVEESDWEENEESGLWERTLIKGRKLYDVSPVTLAAYPDTTVAVGEMRYLQKTNVDNEAERGNVQRAAMLREARLRMIKLV